MSATALMAGYVADLAAGDPRRWHPVAGFGATAAAAERAAYAPSRLRGGLLTALLVSGAAAAAELLARIGGGRGRNAALIATTWAALGGRSLRREALRVAGHVEDGDLDTARRGLRALCGRDAETLDADGLARAVVESVAENTSDAVIGPLLWGAVAGAGGVAAYRAANTLDAMFGHRDERYARFGWAPARLDDLMNWPAARLSAGLTCLAAPLVGGSPAATLRVVRRDGGAHPSPNAGRVEAAFAGALGLTLGGELRYGGRREWRARLGDGPAPAAADVARAARLSTAISGTAALTCAGLARALAARRAR